MDDKYSLQLPLYQDVRIWFHERIRLLHPLLFVQLFYLSIQLSASRCNEECAVGSYGQDCKGVCDCANGARCYNIDGGCLCEPGFSGPQCRDRMCPHGKYGMHCERMCLCQDKHTLRWVGVWRRFKQWKHFSEAVLIRGLNLIISLVKLIKLQWARLLRHNVSRVT